MRIACTHMIHKKTMCRKWLEQIFKIFEPRIVFVYEEVSLPLPLYRAHKTYGNLFCACKYLYKMILLNCGLRLNSMQKISTDKMKQCTASIIAFSLQKAHFINEVSKNTLCKTLKRYHIKWILHFDWHAENVFVSYYHGNWQRYTHSLAQSSMPTQAH